MTTQPNPAAAGHGTAPKHLALTLDSTLLPTDSAPLPALTALARAAEDAGIDALILTDRHAASDQHPGTGGLDSSLAVSALGPLTTTIGLVAEVPTAVTEPFHTATASQTADHNSLGRAGLALRPGTDPAEHAAHGRWPQPEAAGVFEDAKDTAHAVTALWDSWEHDAVIRDVPTGRFLDRTRIHNAAFTGTRFTVEGASITPRSPQGRPPLFVTVDDAASASLAADVADVAVVSFNANGSGPETLLRGLNAARAERAGTERPLRIWAGLPTTNPAALAAVDASLDGAALTLSEAEHTAAGLAAALGALAAAITAVGAPATADGDTAAGANHAASGITLRQRLGLPVATNPFTAARQEAARV